MASELLVVPYQRRGYLYSAVFPSTWTQQWPLQLPFDRAVLLEFAPAWTDTPRVPFEATTEQRWPQDVLRYLSTLGCEPQLGPGGVPVVQRDVLRDRDGLILDYVTLVMLRDGPPNVPLKEWSAIRVELQRTLLPETLSLPSGCEAILHIAGHELAVLLAQERQVLANWLSPILALLVRGASASEVVGNALAGWVLRAGDRQGVRIESVELQTVAGHPTRLLVVGRWGRGVTPPLRAGIVGGRRFEMSIPLDDGDSAPPSMAT